MDKEGSCLLHDTIFGFSGDVTEISKAARPSWVAKCLQSVSGHDQGEVATHLHLHTQVGSTASLRQHIAQKVVIGDYVSF